MRLLYWLVFAVPFLLTCKKEDSDYKISGFVTEGTTGHPIVGLPLTAYTSYGDLNAAWNGELMVSVMGTDSTAEDGSFNIMVDETRLDSKNERLILGCPNIPTGYLRTIRIGNYSTKDLFLDINDFYANVNKFYVNANESYSMQMFQKAYFNLVIPTLTQDLKQDTLVLQLSNSTEDYHNYVLGVNSDLLVLQRVRALEAADRAVGTYILRRGTIIKSGSFDIFCPPNDTTAVYLDL